MPTIAAALRGLPANNLILDGELVALDKTGKPSVYELPDELKMRVKHSTNTCTSEAERKVW